MTSQICRYRRVRTRIPDSDTDSDVSTCFVRSIKSVSSYQLKNKGKGTKNVVEIKDDFDTQQLEESFKMSKNYKKYGTS